MNPDTLAQFSKEELIALILAQAEVIARQTAQIEALTKQIDVLMKRVEALEAELGKPPKTPDNSSVPPSQGQKPNRAERRAGKRRKGHPGAFRQLSETPDRVVETLAAACPHCDHVLCAADQSEFHAYDHIDLPPIKPVVTRVHRHRGVCPCCRRGFSAPFPEGMAPGSPFGPNLAALILHLHVTQAISFERLVRLMDEVFGVTISEGAIANLLRDSQYAIDEGDTAFAPGFKHLLLRAVAIGRRRETLKDSTLVQYRADLDRRLTRLLGQPPTTSAGRKLARAIRKCRNDLFIFITRRDVPYTNNGCERALRPSVIFRKVTGSFRSYWGARLYAAAASVIATGRLHGKSALRAIQDVIAAQPAAVIS